jgi:hypothetical protein
MKKFIFTTVASLSLIGCATIEYKTNVSQKLDTPIMAGVGDTIYKSTTEKSLPNAVGKADIFGRTTPTATTVVIFEGIRDGVALFRRRTVDIDTGATTMNSSPIVISNNESTTTSGFVGNTPIYGQSTTNRPTTVLPPPTPNVRYMERNSNLISVDMKSTPSNIVVEGMLIRILKVDSGSVTYTITKTN